MLLQTTIQCSLDLGSMSMSLSQSRGCELNVGEMVAVAMGPLRKRSWSGGMV